MASSSSSAPSPTQGTKRKQTLITSWLPIKKGRIETAPTPEERKSAANARKVKEREEKRAAADAKKAQEVASKAAKAEERMRKTEAKRNELASAKAAKAEEKRKLKETNKAEEDAAKTARARIARCRQDWGHWVEENQMPDTTFEIPVGDADAPMYLNGKDSVSEYGVKLNERRCLPHCEVENPVSADYEPMKLYRRGDLLTLAFRKEAMLNGVSQEMSDREFLRHGKELLEKRTGQLHD